MSAAKRQKVSRKVSEKSALRVSSKLLSVSKLCPEDDLRYFEGVAKEFFTKLYASVKVSYVGPVLAAHDYSNRVPELDRALINDIRKDKTSSFEYLLKTRQWRIDVASNTLHVQNMQFTWVGLEAADVDLAKRDVLLAFCNSRYTPLIMKKCKALYQQVNYVRLLDRTVKVRNTSTVARFRHPIEPRSLVVLGHDGEVFYPECKTSVPRYINGRTTRVKAGKNIVLKGTRNYWVVPGYQNESSPKSFHHLIKTITRHLDEGCSLVVLQHLTFVVDRSGRSVLL